MKSKKLRVHTIMDLHSSLDFYLFNGSYFNKYPHHMLQFQIFSVLHRWISFHTAKTEVQPCKMTCSTSPKKPV